LKEDVLVRGSRDKKMRNHRRWSNTKSDFLKKKIIKSKLDIMFLDLISVVDALTCFVDSEMTGSNKLKQNK
jgi:hypothetical protein